MDDSFLKEQLELLRKLNERVSKIQDDVNHNVELLAQNRREAERWRREERVYRQRSGDSDPQHPVSLGRRKDDRLLAGAADAAHPRRASRQHHPRRKTRNPT